MIRYTEDKEFTQEQTTALFRSVGWTSAGYPSRLYKALRNSSTVITAWEGSRLVGLARALDDTELTAYIKYVLVDPAYQGFGIAGTLMEMLKEKYRDYLYIDGMPEDAENVPFYEKHGFRLLENGAAIQIQNRNENLKY